MRLRDGGQAAGDRAGLTSFGQVADIERYGRWFGWQGLKLATDTPGGEIVPVGAVGRQRVRGLGLGAVVPGAFGGRLDLGGDRGGVGGDEVGHGRSLTFNKSYLSKVRLAQLCASVNGDSPQDSHS